MSDSLTVMVTGVGGGGHGMQILKALRLAKTKYTVVGSDMSPVSKGLMEVDHAYLLPPAGDESYLASLLAVCRRHGVRALFHGSEPELKVMSARREEIEAQGLFLPINPRRVIDLCMDKSETARFLAEHGFDCPRTVRVGSEADLEAIDFLPVVLKPSVGGGGSADVLLAQTQQEAEVLGRYLLDTHPEIVAQEYVGSPDAEYTVGVLVSMDGELLNSIAVRRFILSSLSNRTRVPNRTGDGRLGPVLAISSGISQGEIGRFPEVTTRCEELALALGCRGAINIQCRLVGDRVSVFEINPRFSGTTSLRAMVGYNEPDVLIRRHVLGEAITPGFEYGSGYIVRGVSERFIESTDFPKGRDLLSE